MAKLNVERNEAVRRHPVLLVLSILTIVLVFTVYTLYPVARDFYSAWRDSYYLESEYKALLERNEKIRQLVDDLRTPEGIIDKAREEFGWVLQDEKAVNITGLNLTEGSKGLPASIEPGTVQVEEIWWMLILDFIFGVEDKVPANQNPDYIIPGL